MKIVMLSNMSDGEILVWNKGDIFEIENANLPFYKLKEINGQMYAIDKKDENVTFIKINERN